ncbi:MAG: hypothetical protein WBG73_22815 [Coleofasciculaceae cyanobacterium]
MVNNKVRVPEIKVVVLGVKFQAFLDPAIDQAVFSLRGTSRALKISYNLVRDILASEEFNALQGRNVPRRTLDTEVNPNPISVVTQADLVLLVQIAAEKGYPIAKSMQEASFSVLLQQSVDEALGVDRTRKQYLEAGANLRQRLEYRYSYHEMKKATFNGGHGVRALCKVNKQVSNLAVPDADQRRSGNASWRKKCSGSETVKITVGNTVHQKAVEASNRKTLNNNLDKAADRTRNIYDLIDAPF